MPSRPGSGLYIIYMRDPLCTRRGSFVFIWEKKKDPNLPSWRDLNGHHGGTHDVSCRHDAVHIKVVYIGTWDRTPVAGRRGL